MQNVEIIKLKGAIEIAPILGLSDYIVDLVQTGNTLKENGLSELEVIQKEYQSMATELDSMVKEYEQQSLMMSEELKKAKEQDIVDMNNSMQSYQLSKVGPNGELTRKQAQLEFELVEKFKAAVNAVAISKGFDLIIDGSQASLYTKPTIDLTDDVLYELRKTNQSSE